MSSTPCNHSLIFINMCSLCGAIVSTPEKSPTKVPVGKANLSLYLSSHEAEKRASSHLDTVLRTRRLSLVLDLDHTLLHSCGIRLVDKHLVTSFISDLEFISTEEAPLSYFELHDAFYFVQVRPYAKALIKRLKEKYYDIYVFTMGTAPYAVKCLEVLDVIDDIPVSNVLSREDADAPDVKSLVRLFPTDTTTAIILDDRFDVWPEHHQMLHILPPFFHWSCNFLKDASLFALLPTPRDASLLHCTDFLIDLHDKFFSSFDKGIPITVAKILESRRLNLFSNYKFYFAFNQDGRLNTLVKMCGSKIFAYKPEEASHVIVGQDTGKWAQFQAPGVLVVEKEWLYCSLAGLKVLPENKFIVGLEHTLEHNPEFIDEFIKVTKRIYKYLSVKRDQEIFEELTLDSD
ncbi:hypothetical protein RCL1_002013 [Eukaryota sp. TZLM3-RCL]